MKPERGQLRWCFDSGSEILKIANVFELDGISFIEERVAHIFGAGAKHDNRASKHQQYPPRTTLDG